MRRASRRGMMVDMPSPAGVIAPVRLIPTVTSSSSISSAYRRHASASRPALYARNALSTRSATVSRPVTGLGSMRGPRRKSLRDMVPPPSGLVGWHRERLAAALAGAAYDLYGLARAVGDVQQVEILGGDLALPRDAVAQPPGEPLPVLQAEQDDREVFHLARLDQRERFEQLVHRAVTAGKHDEGGRILHEHRLADEEVSEVDGALDVGVEPLLERQLDVATDREAVPFLAAAVRRLHDPRAAPGDDGEPVLREHARGRTTRTTRRPSRPRACSRRTGSPSSPGAARGSWRRRTAAARKETASRSVATSSCRSNRGSTPTSSAPSTSATSSSARRCS